MWSLYVLLKTAKLLAASVFLGSSLGSLVVRDEAERQRLVYRLTGPALLLTWVLGFALMSERGLSVLSGWILGALAGSLFALLVLLWQVGVQGRRGPISTALFVLSLLWVLWLMVAKPWPGTPV